MKLTGSQLIRKFTAFYGTRGFHSHIHNSPPPASIPSQSNSAHASSFHFLMIHCNIILPSTPPAKIFQVASFLQISPPNPPVRATRPARFILLDPIIRITFVGGNTFYEASYIVLIGAVTLCYSIFIKYFIQSHHNINI